MQAKLILSDGTRIKISKQTEAELRAAFTKKLPEDYVDANIKVHIDVDSSSYPIEITTTGDTAGEVSRSVKDINNLIVYDYQLGLFYVLLLRFQF